MWSAPNAAHAAGNDDCRGDSHTSTHGAFGTLAFGIGTSQVADALATQTLAMAKLKVRRINFSGSLKPGVYAKDVALAYIHHLGVNGGVGYAYEFGGDIIDHMTMEERMTVCNMSIEGGARCGYVNPDQTTYDYLKGRDYCPEGEAWERAVADWQSLASDADAEYDDVIEIKGEDIEPFVTWGITPAQSVGVSQDLPQVDSFADSDQLVVREAYEYMSFEEGQPIIGTPVNVVFIGSSHEWSFIRSARGGKICERQTSRRRSARPRRARFAGSRSPSHRRRPR